MTRLLDHWSWVGRRDVQDSARIWHRSELRLDVYFRDYTVAGLRWSRMSDSSGVWSGFVDPVIGQVVGKNEARWLVEWGCEAKVAWGNGPPGERG